MGNGVSLYRQAFERLGQTSALGLVLFLGAPAALAADVAQPTAAQAMAKLKDTSAPQISGVQALSTLGIPACANSGAKGMVGIPAGGADLSDLLNRNPESLQCSDVRGESIDLLKKGLISARAQIKTAAEGIECALAASEKVKSYLSSYRGQVETRLTSARGDVQKAEQFMQDMQAKAKFAEESEKELTAVKGELEKFQTAIDANVATVKNAVRQLKNRKTNLVQMKQAAQMQEAMRCFKEQTNPQMGCSDPVTGQTKAVSAYEHALCIYGGRAAATANGGSANRRVLRSDTAAIETGNRARSNLQSVLDDMINSVPSLDSMSSGQSGGTAAPTVKAGSIKNFRSLTPADVAQGFSSRLDQFNQVGMSANGASMAMKQFVLSQLQSCYNQSRDAVEKASTLEGGPLALEQEAITSQEEGMKAINQAKFKEAQQLYERVTSATSRFTTGGRSMNIAACEDSQLDGQLSCLQKIRAEMNGQLTGQSASAVNTLKIQGTMPANYIGFSCSGINNCLNSLKVLKTDLATQTASMSQQISTFKSDIYKNIQSQMQQEAQKVSVFSQGIQSQVAGLSSLLSKLGITARPRSSTANKSEGLGRGEDGFPTLPGDFGAAMGGLATPPITELDPDSLESVHREISKKSLSIQKLEEGIQEKVNECKKEAREEFAKYVDDVAACVHNKRVMCNNSTGELSSLGQAWARVGKEMSAQFEKEKDDYPNKLAYESSGLDDLLNGSGNICAEVKQIAERRNEQEYKDTDKINDDAVKSAQEQVSTTCSAKKTETDEQRASRISVCNQSRSELAQAIKNRDEYRNQSKQELKDLFAMGEQSEGRVTCEKLPGVLRGKLDTSASASTFGTSGEKAD